MKINRMSEEVTEVLFNALECSCEKCPVEKCTAFGNNTEEICRENLKRWLYGSSVNLDFDAHKTITGMRLDAGFHD